MYELVNHCTCIRNCLLIISAMVLGELRVLITSFGKVNEWQLLCCDSIRLCTKLMGVDKLPVELQSVRLHQNGEVHNIQENITVCIQSCAGTSSQDWLDMQL